MRILSQRLQSKIAGSPICLRRLHVHRGLGDDDDNDVHHKSADRVGKGTLDRHQETICSLFRGSLIDNIGVFDRDLLVMNISILKLRVHTLACRFHRAGCRGPHAVRDIDVEYRDQDARRDGESD